ncbi:MAG: hypothetical protein QOK29_2654 [Rhodospirillaceae bacterium]|nr:hypothetical protein [Rhodospirillaceae bacterium]
MPAADPLVAGAPPAEDVPPLVPPEEEPPTADEPVPLAPVPAALPVPAADPFEALPVEDVPPLVAPAAEPPTAEDPVPLAPVPAALPSPAADEFVAEAPPVEDVPPLVPPVAEPLPLTVAPAALLVLGADAFVGAAPPVEEVVLLVPVWEEELGGLLLDEVCAGEAVLEGAAGVEALLERLAADGSAPVMLLLGTPWPSLRTGDDAASRGPVPVRPGSSASAEIRSGLTDCSAHWPSVVGTLQRAAAVVRIGLTAVGLGSAAAWRVAGGAPAGSGKFGADGSVRQMTGWSCAKAK